MRDIIGVTKEEAWVQDQAELAALRAEVAEQCRLNAMGAEREAKLMAEVAELKGQLRSAGFDYVGAMEDRKMWRGRAEVAERKLAEAVSFIRALGEEVSSQGDRVQTLAKVRELKGRLATAERNALERAAKVCEERSEQHAFDMNTSWQAEECAEFIRALMKEGGE
jgi:hypothetical protein